MDVYLVPVARDRYELYCEVPDDPDETPDSRESRGLFRRLKSKFREVLAEAERERRLGRSHRDGDGWMARIKARSMRWVAESIAEQRLLWHLRGQTEARLFHPDDVAEADALLRMRTSLGRDFEKHRFWLIIDSIGFVLSGLLALIPGPNMLAYYFAFRLVGHYLSLRGARQGLRVVAWRTEKSAPLADLRDAIGLEPEVRVRRVHDIAVRLRLEHLATFFERIAVSTN